MEEGILSDQDRAVLNMRGLNLPVIQELRLLTDNT